jgi:hypothetical protein
VSGDVVVENEEGLPPKTLLHSYCCLDYGRMLDVTQLRLFRLRKALKDKIQDRRVVVGFSFEVTAFVIALCSCCQLLCAHIPKARSSLPLVWGSLSPLSCSACAALKLQISPLADLLKCFAGGGGMCSPIAWQSPVPVAWAQ